MNKATEAAWEKLLREHPELRDLPDPPNRPDPPMSETSRPTHNEVALFFQWAAEIRESLDEPDRTILDLFGQGLMHRQIGDKINRSRGFVTGRLRKIKARFGGQLSANAFRGWRNW